MQISSLKPEYWAGSDAVARFNVSVSPDVHLCGLKLYKRADGSWRVRAPRVGGNAAFHLAPRVCAELTEAAKAVYERPVPHVQR